MASTPARYEFSITTTGASDLIVPSYSNVAVPYLVKPPPSNKSLRKRIASVFIRKRDRGPSKATVFSTRHAYMTSFEELERMPHYAARVKRLVEYEDHCELKEMELIASRR